MQLVDSRSVQPRDEGTFRLRRSVVLPTVGKASEIRSRVRQRQNEFCRRGEISSFIRLIFIILMLFKEIHKSKTHSFT